MASERDIASQEIVEELCKKHFPQLKFYPELLLVIQEAYDAGYKAGVEAAAKEIYAFDGGKSFTSREKIAAAIRALAEGEKP